MSTAIPWDLIIVIPCYNEGVGFQEYTMMRFLQAHPKVMLCLVNDGSKDQTLERLYSAQKRSPAGQVIVLERPKNEGKASAVRAGMLHCVANYEAGKFAFLDADLAAPLEECLRVGNYIRPNLDLAFGSRICRLGAKVKRKWFRFIVGRIVATAISWVLRIKVYDTQCGCKVFNSRVVEKVFKDPFMSKWLFDVEIFFRLLASYQKERILLCEFALEVPLDIWIDKGDSKVSFGYGFKLWWDLLRIRLRYRF